MIVSESMRARRIYNLKDIFAVTRILYNCGKDMARQYDIHHWDNSKIKTLLIVIICAIKNHIFVVENDNMIVATYQTTIKDKSLHFEKLAVEPQHNGKGIGSFCLQEIEKEARDNGCRNVEMDVYSKSEHAIQFYINHGYTHVKNNNTLKYEILCFEKGI